MRVTWNELVVDRATISVQNAIGQGFWLDAVSRLNQSSIKVYTKD